MIASFAAILERRTAAARCPVVELVSAITQRCDAVTVLATRREPLGVVGEQVIPIPSLEVGNAVELFHDRATPDVASHRAMVV